MKKVLVCLKNRWKVILDNSSLDRISSPSCCGFWDETTFVCFGEMNFLKCSVLGWLPEVLPSDHLLLLALKHTHIFLVECDLVLLTLTNISVTALPIRECVILGIFHVVHCRYNQK